MIRIDERFDVPDAPPRAVWGLLADPRNVVACVQGAALGQEHEDGSFDGSLTVKFGPAKVTFRARIELELDDEAMAGRVTAKGKDSQGGTRFRAAMGFTVAGGPEGRGSTVLVEGETELAGKLAGVVEAGAKIVVARMAADFAQKLAARCASMLAPAGDGEPATAATMTAMTPAEAAAAPSAGDGARPAHAAPAGPAPAPASRAWRPARGLAARQMADLREMARKRLPRQVFAYVEGGAGTEVALRNNRLAFDRIRLCPRGLADVPPPSTRTVLFGREQSLPLAVAPTGAADLLWHRGEIELARAAAAAGVPFTVVASTPSLLEAVAEAAGGRLWFQLPGWPEGGALYPLLDRARTAGYETLVVAPEAVGTGRETGGGRCSALDAALHPRWLFGVMARRALAGAAPPDEGDGQAPRPPLAGPEGAPRATQRGVPFTWNDLRSLRQQWQGPLVVKGVLHPEDARRAVECGADGLIVSNHGGRYFDSAPTSMDALPAVADAVGQRATVMVDSGFTCGADVVKALALGAQGVLLGRAPLYGLAAAGQAGAQRVLELFHEHMLRTMAQMGCGTLEQVAHAGVWPGAAAGLMNPQRTPARAAYL